MERGRKGLRAPERAWGRGTPTLARCLLRPDLNSLFLCLHSPWVVFFSPKNVVPAAFPLLQDRDGDTWLCGLLCTVWIWGFVQHIPIPECGMRSVGGWFGGCPSPWQHQQSHCRRQNSVPGCPWAAETIPSWKTMGSLPSGRSQTHQSSTTAPQVWGGLEERSDLRGELGFYLHFKSRSALN